MTDNAPTRHILSLSGGKDSTALAVYMRDRVPEMEYVFCDTGEELKETYEYLKRVEANLGRPVKYLRSKRDGFEDLLKARRNFLPSATARWCTQYLKIAPFEQEVGDASVISYIAIRADEAHRKGYISTKPNITARYPFIEDGVRKDDVLRLLSESGLGMPTYYEWRSRSGCYFCFFQRRIEWVGLLERHPDLYWKAAQFEKSDPQSGRSYTWNSRESLVDLAKPERVQQIREEAERRRLRDAPRSRDPGLLSVFANDGDDDDDGGCLICHL